MNLKCLFGFHEDELTSELDFFEPLPDGYAGDPGSMNERTFVCSRCGHKKIIVKRWHVEKFCEKCHRETKHENTIVGENGQYCGQGDGIQRSECIICGLVS